MQNNTNLSENVDLSGKPVIGPSEYNQPASQANPPSIASDAHRTPIPQPVLPPSRPHGHTNGGLETHSQLYPQLRAASNMMQRGASSTSEELGPVSSSPAATTMTAQGIIGHDLDDSITDGRKAKRELSSSKRAAQNRAAQRAFRQRKEHYIKKLEQQVREFGELEHTFKSIQNDNYALRDYVIQLQSRLLELQVELPQPPPNVNITQPGAPSTARQPQSNAPVEPPPNAASAGTLADVAAAVAGLRAREPMPEGNYAKPNFKSENSASAHPNDELRRQLQPETLPPPSSLRA
ncbi:hypothetical protein F4678DRAFT_51282 [Xylaria arbuscula]|nr:hypothetical protein F4678DRAFT_51282 [Xylaria arbuscula]